MNGENKRCYLNMIQNVIERMGRNSFALKSWSVGMMIAIFAFAGKNSHKAAVITIVPLIASWFLDAYFLTVERKLRALYDNARLKKEEDIDFDMNFNNIKVDMKELKRFCFVNAFASKTIFPFYLVCIIVTVIVYLINF